MTDRTPPDADVIAAIPDNIRAELARRNMTGQQARELLGMSWGTWRRRQITPANWTYQELLALADVLGVSIAALVGGEDR